jgi:hypothetical protein
LLHSAFFSHSNFLLLFQSKPVAFVINWTFFPSVSRTNSGDRIEKNEMGVVCSRYREEHRRIQDFGKEKPEGKKSLVRPRRRWEYNVRDGSSGSGIWEYGLDGAGSGEGIGGGHL